MNFEWIPVKTRPKTEEEKESYPNCECMFDCILPKDGEDILISLKFIGWNGNTYYDVDMIKIRLMMLIKIRRYMMKKAVILIVVIHGRMLRHGCHCPSRITTRMPIATNKPF